MNKLTFDINNGNRQVWEQCKHNGVVQLYNLEQDWEMNNLVNITPAEMVMLSNIYRELKRLDILDAFINPDGQIKLISGDSITSAIEKQKAKRPDIHEYMFGGKSAECPQCHTALMNNATFEFHYCPGCGQAIDWSDFE